MAKRKASAHTETHIQVEPQTDTAITAIPAETPIASDYSLLGEGQLAPQTDPQLPPESQPAAISEAATPPVQPLATTITDLGAFVAALSPSQLEKIKALAAAKGLTPAGLRKGPNGGLLIEVEIPEEVVEPFAVWAEAAGEPLADFIRKITADSLVSYCYQDWGEAASARSTMPAMPANTMNPPAAGVSAPPPASASVNPPAPTTA